MAQQWLDSCAISDPGHISGLYEYAQNVNYSSNGNPFGGPYYGYDMLGKILPTSLTTIILGWRFWRNNSSDIGVYNNVNPLQILDTNATQCCGIGFNGSHLIQVADPSNTILGTATIGPIAVSGWTYIEVKAVAGSASNGSITVYVNSVQVLALTSVTTSTALASYQQFIWRNGANANNANPRICDIYVNDGTGAVNNTFKGDTRVYALWPASNGRVDVLTRTGGTGAGNYTAVNENSGTWPDDDTSYNSSATPGDEDCYGLGALPGNVTAVTGVRVSAWARKDDGSPRTFKLGVGNNTTESWGATQSLSASYKYYHSDFDINPLTSANWALGDFSGGSALQAAVEVVS
jgi:hypothetical protein